MINQLEDIKKLIKEWSSEKVDIVISLSDNDLYNALVDVYCNDTSGTTFILGRGITYNDALNIAERYYEELKFVKSASIVNEPFKRY